MAKSDDGNIRILSMDGGPGPLVHVHVLERIEKELQQSGQSLLQKVNLFAGTSDGALLALYLAMELTKVDRRQSSKTPAEIVSGAIDFSNEYVKALAMSTEGIARSVSVLANLFEIAMAPGKAPGKRLEFLGRKLGELAANALGSLATPLDLWAIRGFLLGERSFNDGAVLRSVLENHFGKKTLGWLTRHIVVVSFDTEEWAPRAFRNFAAEDKEGSRDRDRDSGLTLVDVGMSTSAFPGVMPVYGGQSQRGFLDGIFAVNNPVMTATSLALRHLVPASVARPMDRLRVLSFGIEQTREEKLIERNRGLLALLALLAVDDRDARLSFIKMSYSERFEYLFSAARRRELQARMDQQQLGLGHRTYGWADFVGRPTFMANMFVHGNDDEAWRVCRRLFRSQEKFEPRAHRLKIRINVARAMWRLMVQYRDVLKTDLPDVARRCFERGDGEARTSDDETNAERVQALEKWLKKHWLEDPNAAAAPKALPAPKAAPAPKALPVPKAAPAPRAARARKAAPARKAPPPAKRATRRSAKPATK